MSTQQMQKEMNGTLKKVDADLKELGRCLQRIKAAAEEQAVPAAPDRRTKAVQTRLQQQLFVKLPSPVSNFIMVSQQDCLKAVTLAVVAIAYAYYGQTRHIGTALTTLSLVAVVSLLTDLVTLTPSKKATPDDRLQDTLQDLWAFCTKVNNFVRRPLVQDCIFSVLGFMFVKAFAAFGLVTGSAVVLMALLVPTLRPFCQVAHGWCGSQQPSEGVAGPYANNFWFEQDKLSFHDCLRISEMIDSITAVHEQEVCEVASTSVARLDFVNGSEEQWEDLMAVDK